MRPLPSFLVVFFLTLWGTGIAAQKAVPLSPRSMNRYGIRAGNYSGITPLGDGCYAVVDDKYPGEGFFVFRIRQDHRTGQVTGVVNEGFRGTENTQGYGPDAEGVAFRAADSTVWISRESDQRIPAYRVRDGRNTGCELAVPDRLGVSAIVPNYGFEALAYDAGRAMFWTMSENVLKSDGDVLSPGVRESACLRLQGFGEDGQPGVQYAYMPDLPSVPVKGRQYAVGVVALWVQPDGSLLVMEREIDVARKWLRSKTHIRIYKVFLSEEHVLPAGAVSGGMLKEKALKKQLVASFSTRMRLFRPKFANYEGMCEGAPLSDGRRTLLLVADSQNGYGNRLCHLRDWLRVLVLPEDE